MHGVGLADAKLLLPALLAVAALQHVNLLGLVVGGVVAGLGWLLVRRPLTALFALLTRTRLRRVLTAA